MANHDFGSEPLDSLGQINADDGAAILSEASSDAGCAAFVLVPEARLLLLDGRPVTIGGRAFDLLVVLTRYRGQTVSKETIFRSVWPNTFVEESNLRFQMGLLRKALGRYRHLIITIHGRGYLLAIDGVVI